MSASRRAAIACRIGIAILSVALVAGLRTRSVATVPMALLGPPRTAQAAPAAVAGGPVKVSEVTIGSGMAGETFVDVATSGPTPFHVQQLKDPRRLVIDLEGAHNATRRKSYAAKSPLLKDVRIGQFRSKDPAVVRVVADLNNDPVFDVHAPPGGVRIELKPRELAQASAPQAVRPGQPPPGAPAQQPSPPPPGAPQQAPSPVPQAPPVQAAPPAQPLSAPFARRSPLRSLPQNEKMLDSLGLRIVLTFNYRKGKPDEVAWKTEGAPGVAANRLFIKPMGPGSYRTIELAVTPSPQGGYDLVVYGQQIEATAQGPNPELAAIQQLVNEEATRMEQAPPVPDMQSLSYETYYLSYVVADRALALLKALGYTTVEFNGQAGESADQNIFQPLKLGTGRPPIIVKLIDSSKTSLMEPTPSVHAAPGAPVMPQMVPQAGVGAFGATPAGVPTIGGTYLYQMTSGETQERLLILYDKNDPDSLQSLINLLQTTVDVPSRQIMIEALVIEINSNRLRDLGVTFETVQNSVDVANAALDTNTESPTYGLPLSIFTFTKGAAKAATFTAALQALVQKGEGEILSNPSVLVLDDRQARIQIGQQVPVSQQVTSLGTTVSSVNYFPVGIVLNLRPRINDDGSEITMQTETIVSAINRTATNQIVGTQAFVAPVVDNRQVQSIVRVADNTPFIIGGLISTNDQTNITGIPFLADIPVLGHLFRTSSVSRVKQEVIIVVTPHVVPLEEKYFSYVIPKDSEEFNRFDKRLFRNAYRIRGDDIFDLEFIKESNVYKELASRVTAASAKDPELREAQPFKTVLNGGPPGEEILVHRMLYEIIRKRYYGQYVNPDNIVFFEDNPSAVGGAGFQLAFLMDKLRSMKGGTAALALTFEAQPKGTEDSPFVPPKAVVTNPDVTAENYARLLLNGNDRNPDGTANHWMILISKNYAFPGMRPPPLDFLRIVLVLKRLLELNRSMPMTLKEFHIGRQIVFPSQEELRQSNQFIDREVAKLFYEVMNYYPAFEQEFNRQVRSMNARLEKTNQP